MQLLEEPIIIDRNAGDAESKAIALFIEIAQAMIAGSEHLHVIQNSADDNRFYYHGSENLTEYQLIAANTDVAANAWRLERYYADIADTMRQRPGSKKFRPLWSTSSSIFVFAKTAIFIADRKIARLVPFREGGAPAVRTAMVEAGGRSLVHPVAVHGHSAHEAVATAAAIQACFPSLAEALTIPAGGSDATSEGQ